MKELIIALCLVESSADPNAINNDAVGILQIRPIMVEDVNRILGYPAFDLLDRYDIHASMAMCEIYLSHYKEEEEGLVHLGAKWLCGPSGLLEDGNIPLDYCRKIQENLNRINENKDILKLWEYINE